jgi:oligopeptide/dipeptide ABC transporter ATP-binding protein
MADTVIVMYAGRIVECETARDVFHSPLHPYTAGLMKSRPRLCDELERLETIPGSVPDLSRLPEGCRFRSRCNRGTDECARTYPGETRIGATHTVHCFHWQESLANAKGDFHAT